MFFLIIEEFLSAENLSIAIYQFFSKPYRNNLFSAIFAELIATLPRPPGCIYFCY